MALMQNVPPEDQQVLERALEALDKREVEPNVKALLLGLELINVVGVDVCLRRRWGRLEIRFGKASGPMPVRQAV